ncbi:type I-E CRISPR-associated protein Cas6/Cse3/CasE [Nesterenkonia marinintestina]|uniref:type I-E CRISPR-associated protein Cas6/Cse3/CasE n=1 Tax=Nesterenkonia marinintestina TaxID=2979865 RepID=UPI0021BF3067|nr:type I-E CRISPR-associated protein Cas6/Cse3/CasE [Nesterenkonia sp. GX14115]
MTWFSALQVNPRRREARRYMSDPQSLHAAVLNAFPPQSQPSQEGRALWRLDASEHDQVLYIVSPEKPDLSALHEGTGWEQALPRFTEYDPFLSRLRKGQQWGFRLRANPVKSIPREGRRGKVVPHVTPDQQLAWLTDRSGRHGFSVGSVTDPSSLTAEVTGRTDQRFGRRSPDSARRTTVTLRQAQFDGSLVIEDADAFRATLVDGIGRGKAYGCGLLTLKRI